jgi:hypothetical protein
MIILSFYFEQGGKPFKILNVKSLKNRIFVSFLDKGQWTIVYGNFFVQRTIHVVHNFLIIAYRTKFIDNDALELSRNLSSGPI